MPWHASALLGHAAHIHDGLQEEEGAGTQDGQA